MKTKKEDKIKLKIMKELGLEKVDEKKQNELLVKMGEVILKKVFVEVVEKLDEEGKEEFEKILAEKKTADEITDFLQSKLPDYDKMVNEIVEELITEIKN